MRRFLFIVTGIGAVLLALAVYSYMREMDFLSRAVSTTGIVTDYQVRRNGDRESYCPIFVFTRMDGQTVLYYGDVCASAPAFEIGQQVEVLYDPLDVEWAQMNNFWSKYRSILILFGIGLSIFLIGLYGLFSRKAEPNVRK